VPNAALEARLAAAAAGGVPAAVIFASCQDPAPPPAGEPSLAERLRRTALDAGMAVCGGNGMGFFNLEHSLRVCGYPEPAGLPCGPVAVVSHSGSVFSALLHNDRGLRFNLVVSAGMELVTTAAAYLDHALELPSTRVVALFLETVREPAAFRAALAKAAARGVHVVALKVGRGEAAGRMVAAHSGALAGEDGAYQALFDAYGVARVRSLDELLTAGRRAFPGGLAAIHDSGGERAHLMDLAEELEVPLARLSEATRARLAAVLEPGLPATNPLDAWGTGNDADEIFAACIRALLDDPDTGALAVALDLTTEPTPETSWTGLAIQAAAATAKPVAVLGNLASAVDRADAARLRAAGSRCWRAPPPAWRPWATSSPGGTSWPTRPRPELTAPRPGRPPARPPRRPPPPRPLEPRPGRPPAPPPRCGPDGGSGWRTPGRSARWRPWRCWPTGGCRWSRPRRRPASTPLWPPPGGVALKTAATGVRHKSGVGGVRLGLAGPEQLAAAYADLAGRLGPRVVVARMAAGGVELAIGVVRDPQFGPLVMVAAGGVLVEVLRDRRFALPPVDARTARATLDRLAVRPLLDGAGASGPPADLDAVADAVVALSALAVDLGDRLVAVDVNPLVAGPEGCVAVDALVVRAPA